MNSRGKRTKRVSKRKQNKATGVNRFRYATLILLSLCIAVFLGYYIYSYALSPASGPSPSEPLLAEVNGLRIYNTTIVDYEGYPSLIVSYKAVDQVYVLEFYHGGNLVDSARVASSSQKVVLKLTSNKRENIVEPRNYTLIIYKIDSNGSRELLLELPISVKGVELTVKISDVYAIGIGESYYSVKKIEFNLVNLGDTPLYLEPSRLKVVLGGRECDVSRIDVDIIEPKSYKKVSVSLVNAFISEREVDVEIIIDGVYRVFVERLDLEQYVRLRYI